MLLKRLAVYVHVHYCTLTPDPLCVATSLSNCIARNFQKRN